MFGFAVGMLAEYATSSDFVDQVKILLSNFGIVDLEVVESGEDAVDVVGVVESSNWGFSWAEGAAFCLLSLFWICVGVLVVIFWCFILISIMGWVVMWSLLRPAAAVG
ncbi:hypothetical protein LOK49_LG11G00707 [Camellia lanceoleosa]|uniref:Uncharacterized protein n=1 Tax=Camellia lanceoleosa TaxID=1840588 RepID=A0ACC0G0F5_9ERIC|nr:hypothetical protein LOK49_LG11G00707 [Camellia lanceoleosa]